MVTAVCIACKQPVIIGPNPKKGQFVTCDHCHRQLEIIRVNPPLLDWLMDKEDIEEISFDWTGRSRKSGDINVS